MASCVVAPSSASSKHSGLNQFFVHITRFRLCNDNDASDVLDDYNVCYVLDGIDGSDFLGDIKVSDVPVLDDYDAYDVPDGIDACNSLMSLMTLNYDTCDVHNVCIFCDLYDVFDNYTIQ